MSHPLAEFLRHPDPTSPTKFSDGMTQAELAELLGVRQPFISKFLRGHVRQLSTDMARKIEKISKGRVPVISLVYETPHFLQKYGAKAKKGAK